MSDDTADYQNYLDQDRVWPQVNSGHLVSNASIQEMAPQHAISAYHKLLRWGLGSPRANLTESMLAQALLTQAVGEPVWLLSSMDIPAKAVSVLRKTYQIDAVPLELCFDALAIVGEMTPGLHPIKRAQWLQTYINEHLGEQ